MNPKDPFNPAVNPPETGAEPKPETPPPAGSPPPLEDSPLASGSFGGSPDTTESPEVASPAETSLGLATPAVPVDNAVAPSGEPGVTAEELRPENATDSTLSTRTLDTQLGNPSEADIPSPGGPPMPVLPVVTHSHRKKGLIIGIIIAFVILVLSAGAAASYFYVMNSPRTILKEALANSLDKAKTKTIHYDGDLKVQNKADHLNIGGTYEGAADDASGAFTMKATTDILTSKVTVETRSLDGKTLYMKLTGLETLAQLLGASGDTASSYAPVLTALDNQWIEIDQSLVEDAGNISYKQLSDADRQKIVDAFGKHPFLVIKDKLPNEAIKGTASYHYQIGIDKKALKGFVAELKASNFQAIKLTQKNLDEFNKAVDEAKLEHLTFGVWIAKDKKMINQLSFEWSEGDTLATVRLTIQSYNQPVVVEKPTGAKSIVQLLTEFYSSPNAIMPTIENGISL